MNSAVHRFVARRLVAAICLGALSLAPALAAAPAPAIQGPALGAPAPAFDLPTIEGKNVNLESLRGKTVVVNVWATWCPPCQAETKDLIAAYKHLAGDDVAFVSVDSTERAALVRAFVAAKNIGWTQALDEKQAFIKAYDVRYFPTTYVIDPQGILRATYIDMITPKLLAKFVADAQSGKNTAVSSALQSKIDALLAPSGYSFSGTPSAVVAVVDRARKAIDKVENMVGDSDPAKNPVDLPRTQAEEDQLRVRAIDALAPLASTHARKLTLDLLRADHESYSGQYAAALKDYRTAVALDPKNTDALAGVSLCARRNKNYGEMLTADRAMVAIDPKSVESLVSFGIDEGVAHHYASARVAFDRAIAAAAAKADARGAKTRDIRMLAWAHLYYGRMEAKAGNASAARRQFALAMQTTVRLPKTDSRYTIYMEQAQEETVALDIGNAAHRKAAISLAPWTGPELPGSSPDTAKYRLVLTAPAGKSVALRAADLPKGWIASFCLDRICAPLRVTTSVPASGVKVIEFQVVPPDAKLLAHIPSVRVIATIGGASASARTVALR